MTATIIREAIEELFSIYEEKLEETIREYNLNPEGEIDADFKQKLNQKGGQG